MLEKLNPAYGVFLTLKERALLNRVFADNIRLASSASARASHTILLICCGSISECNHLLSFRFLILSVPATLNCRDSMAHAASAYRLSAHARRAIISSSVGMSNSEIKLARFNLSRTNLEGLNSLNRISW